MSGPCNSDPEAEFCVCEVPCNVVCIFPGCDAFGTRMVPAELIFGSRDGKLLKTDWGAGVYDDLLTNGGWDSWVCANHQL